MKKLFIVDAMAMAYRTFYALGPNFTNSTGMPVSAIYGSAMFITKLLAEERPDYLVVASDSRARTFRHDLYEGYKANRSSMPEELARQLPAVYDLFRAMRIPVLREEGLEADDFIGSVAKRFAGNGTRVYIVSGDKDFMQLVTDDVVLYQPKTGESAVVVDAAGVREKLGCTPAQVIDVLALMGDASDNVPGVSGIGPKSATKLIETFGSVEGIYENLDKISAKKQRENLEKERDNALLSKKLVTIRTDCALSVTEESLRCDPAAALANEELLAFYRSLELRKLAENTEERLAQASGKVPTSSVVEGVAEVRRYLVVDSRAALDAMMAEVSQSEVVGLSVAVSESEASQTNVIGIALSVCERAAYYLPLHRDATVIGSGSLTTKETADAVRALLGGSARKVGHDLKSAIKALRTIEVEIRPTLADTMVMDYLLFPDGRAHELDDCCLRRLALQKTPIASVVGEKRAKISLEAVSQDALVNYFCEEADLTLRLHATLRARLAEMRPADAMTALGAVEKVFAEIEMPVLPILAEMELVGIHVAKAPLERLGARLKETEDRLCAGIYELAGEEFNIASPAQLQTILFEKMKIHEQLGVKRLKRTQKGFSTDESVLSKLKAHPLVSMLMEYRTVSKLRNTYVDKLQKIAHPKTSRVHGTFNQTGTATGRLSSSDPNLQNIPIRTELGREIRKAFTPQTDDYVLLSADYSQVELRLLAHLSGDEALIKAFLSGDDVHKITASKMFGVDLASVSGELRSRAKAINYGIVYGMGPKRLAEDTGCSVPEASDFIDRYFQTYPGVRAYVDGSVVRARDLGYTETMCGRRRYVSALDSKNEAEAAHARNAAINTPIQGSAADLIKLAMIRIDAELRDAGLKARLLLQVHDEMVFEVPKAEIDVVRQIVKRGMEEAMSLKVPLIADVGVGANWNDAH